MLSLALVAVAGLSLGFATASSPENPSGVSINTKEWTRSMDLDDFAGVVLGGTCSGKQLTGEELREVFPEMKSGGPVTLVASQKALDLVRAPQAKQTNSECSNCTCGACIVVNGQIACTACYACCQPEAPICDATCSSDLAHQIVTSHCGCTVPKQVM